jgi:hypothetical protein
MERALALTVWLPSSASSSLCSLGYEACVHFARLNISTLIFAVRNPKKAETAEQQLYKDVPSFRGKVKVIKLDYDSFESVRSFVREVDSAVERLDFAVLNAGVLNQTYQQTPDGWVQDIQVNVLSTGLLAALLLPKLSTTAKLPLPAEASPLSIKPQLHIVASEGAPEFAVGPRSLPRFNHVLLRMSASPLLDCWEDDPPVDEHKDRPPRPALFARLLWQPPVRRDVQSDKGEHSPLIHALGPVLTAPLEDSRCHDRPQDRRPRGGSGRSGHLFFPRPLQVGLPRRHGRHCCLVRLAAASSQIFI